MRLGQGLARRSSGLAASFVAIPAGTNTSSTLQSDGWYRVIKTGGGSAFNGDIGAAEGIAGEFVMQMDWVSGDCSMGVDPNPTADSGQASINYCYYLFATNLRGIRESGVNPFGGSFGTDGKFMWIIRDASNNLHYLKANTYASAVSLIAAGVATQTGTGGADCLDRTVAGVTGTMKPDASLFAVGDTIDVRFGVPALFA
jgi:hypothetical protein